MNGILIIETTEAADSQDDRFDGKRTHELLGLMDLKAELSIAPTKGDFTRALTRLSDERFSILHIINQGDAATLQLADGLQIGWHDIALQFSASGYAPTVLIISSGCREVDVITSAFERSANRPKIIFGPTASKSYPDYTFAWTTLYRNFQDDGLTIASAQDALSRITAAVFSPFVCSFWDSASGRYRA